MTPEEAEQVKADEDHAFFTGALFGAGALCFALLLVLYYLE